jgi:hypothetical protein
VSQAFVKEAETLCDQDGGCADICADVVQLHLARDNPQLAAATSLGRNAVQDCATKLKATFLELAATSAWPAICEAFFRNEVRAAVATLLAQGHTRESVCKLLAEGLLTPDIELLDVNTVPGASRPLASLVTCFQLQVCCSW